MIRMTLTVLLTLTLTAFTSTADAKKDKGWKGPPPHGNAYGHYKKEWPAYGWYGGYYAPPIYPPPPVYAWPAPPPAYPPAVWRPAIVEPTPTWSRVPEEIPPPPPAPY